MRLTEAYMSLGIVDEAQTAAAVLGHNFPDSPWYKDAYSLVKSAGVEPNENKDSWISRAFKKLGSADADRRPADGAGWRDVAYRGRCHRPSENHGYHPASAL